MILWAAMCCLKDRDLKKLNDMYYMCEGRNQFTVILKKIARKILRGYEKFQIKQTQCGCTWYGWNEDHNYLV